MISDFATLEKALEIALGEGAGEAEAYFESTKGTSVKVFNLQVEKFSFSESMGIGIRVFDGGRYGRSYTSDMSEAAIGQAVRSAVDAATVSQPDPDRGIPPAGSFPDGATGGALMGEELGIWGEDLSAVPAGDKIEFALELERLARGYDERVKGVETSAYSESSGTVLLANSNGFRAGFRSSICYGYLMAIAQQGDDSQTGFGFTAGRSFADLDVGAAAEEAARMAVDLLGARQAETARVPVLFDNLSTAELVAVLGAALSGESVVKGKSFLSDKLGRKVASDSITLVDDGTMEGGFGTSPFDGEGVATSRKGLIGGGELAGFLHNCYTASRMGVSTTGNAGRASYRSQVGVSPTNIFIEAGASTPEELRSAMGRGFEVLELQGVHVGLNPVTGEVSVGAKGIWVEGGRRAHAVREVTIAGSMEDILAGVVGVGSDMRFTPLLGGIGTPSMLVEGLVVGGK